MKDQQLLERITLHPKVMAGKTVIRGTRLTVEYILNLLAHGATVEDILEEYKGPTMTTSSRKPLWSTGFWLRMTKTLGKRCLETTSAQGCCASSP